MLLPLPRSVGAQPRAGSFPDSPQFKDGTFHNRLQSPVVEQVRRTELARDFALKGRSGRPTGPVPLSTPALPATASECAATWLGHATVLLEVGGHFVLTDPMWSTRCSPTQGVGPRRHHPVPLSLEALPEDLAAVLISHDHYDHLDTATVDWLVAHRSAPFVVPLGVGAHLRRWGVPEDRVVELDWDAEHRIGDLTLTCTEAQHFSGRLFTNNTTLWSSWALTSGEPDSSRVSVFFGGDTGYTPAFADIGERHGPFDLSVLPIGAYDHRWSDVHLDPGEALRTHADLRADVLLPVHWATFDLAFHPWAEPVERLVAEAGDVRIVTPRPGERFETSGPLPRSTWWR